MINLNLKAVFHLTQALLPALLAAATDDDPARVINVGSVEGIGIPPWENYAHPASKAALHHLSRHLAANLAAQRITVNAIAPGFFESRMTEFLFQPGRIEGVVGGIPLGRAETYEDIAGAAIYLASRAGAWVTGVVLPIAGGSVTATANRRLADPGARQCLRP